MTRRTTKPSPGQLWDQARGDREHYRALLLEHGYTVLRQPGETAEPLPCGQPTSTPAPDSEAAHD